MLTCSIGGLLHEVKQFVIARRTRVLVTNQLQFTRHADKIVYMQDGHIEEVGTYAQLMAADGGFAKLMNQTEVRLLTSVACSNVSLLWLKR